MIVGVLALQGAFREHIEYFSKALDAGEQVSIEAIRSPDELAKCDALVIPGGESTAMSRIAEQTGMLEPLRKFVQSSKPVWGTCAGLIFLATELVNGLPDQHTLGGLDVCLERNAFGGQLHSFETLLNFEFARIADFPTVFIRAPVVKGILPRASKQHPEEQVEILCELESGFIVAVRQGSNLGTSFHPELSGTPVFHRWFLDEFVLK